MSRAPDLSGRVLDGRYELRDLIGEGTFGRVYRGFDRRLQRAVAVKVIKPWWGEDPAWVERFEREAQLLASVSDPGIVQIFDVGSAEEGVYYVARTRRRREPRAASEARPDRARERARGSPKTCAAGLARAHAERVIHRDVKPANILIDGSGRVKVSDFGVARIADMSPHGAAATALGSPRYMSPEQASGKPTSAASDVYGVGVVLYEMLAGRPPFEGEAPVEVAVRHLQDAPPPLPTRCRRSSRRSSSARSPRIPGSATRTAGRWRARSRRCARSCPRDDAAPADAGHDTGVTAALPLIGATAVPRPRSPTRSPARRPSCPRPPRPP